MESRITFIQRFISESCLVGLVNLCISATGMFLKLGPDRSRLDESDQGLVCGSIHM